MLTVRETKRRGRREKGLEDEVGSLINHERDLSDDNIARVGKSRRGIPSTNVHSSRRYRWQRRSEETTTQNFILPTGRDKQVFSLYEAAQASATCGR